MKHTYSYLIQARNQPKRFQGILGEIDLQKIQFLLVAGRFVIQEVYSGTDPVGWYTQILENQGIYVKSTKKQTLKGENQIWMEVDTEKTPVDEFTRSDEISETDRDSLAWKSIQYPCEANTTKECLGIAVVAKDILFHSGKQRLTVHDVMTAILGTRP